MSFVSSTEPIASSSPPMSAAVHQGFLRWWYSTGFMIFLQIIRAALIIVSDRLSLFMLLKTLFDPWRKDVISYEGLTLAQRFNVWLMNLISRLIGFVIRASFLFAGILIFVGAGFLGIGLMVSWLFLPALVLAGIYFAIILIST